MADSAFLRDAYLRRLMEFDNVLEGFSSSLESVATPALPESALAAMEHVRSGAPLSSAHLEALEAIVIPFLRPVCNVQGDSFAPLPAPWQGINANADRVNAAIRAIGRVEVPGLPGVPYGGTGFLVARNLILTNRHVAELFTSGVGLRNLTFIPGRGARVDLKQEIGSEESILLTVREIRMAHPYWDAAILEVEGVPPGLAPLKLAAQSPAGLDKRLVAVIGYPAMNPTTDVETQLKMFDKVFEKKRLLPGYTMSFRVIESYGRDVEALAHDCSTLGGSSGSAVVDPETGLVLGLHFAGDSRVANYAVPAWELARDARIVDLGVQFAPQPPTNPRPEVEAAWNVILPPPAPVSGAAEGTKAYPNDWLEHATTEDIVEALHTNNAEAQRAIRTTLKPARAEKVIRELTPPPANVEGLFDLFDPDPDPNLPEIVWLHGIMGGHLARPGFLRDRLWLDPLDLAVTNIANALTLASDGSNSASGRNLETDGMLQLFYASAEREWRKNRFVVHNYSYDWRLNIEELADQLHAFLRAKKMENPNRRFLLVAHSMGGLVAAAYAQRHPEWRDTIQKSIFMGSPLGGSYAPLQAFIGTYDFLKKLAVVALRVSPKQLREMAVTLPGLIDMLPHPSLFPDANVGYSTAVWPMDIPAPRQHWLDHSRNLKATLLSSPILDRTTLLVSLNHPTVSDSFVENGVIRNRPATGAGDGTVPARAAVIDGLPAFKVSFDHANIPKDPAAIQAVIDIAKSGQPQRLNAVQPADLTRTFPAPEAPVFQEEALEAATIGIKARFANRQLREADIDWLFRPGMDLPPVE